MSWLVDAGLPPEKSDKPQDSIIVPAHQLFHSYLLALNSKNTHRNHISEFVVQLCVETHAVKFPVAAIGDLLKVIVQCSEEVYVTPKANLTNFDDVWNINNINEWMNLWNSSEDYDDEYNNPQPSELTTMFAPSDLNGNSSLSIPHASSKVPNQSEHNSVMKNGSISGQQDRAIAVHTSKNNVKAPAKVLTCRLIQGSLEKMPFIQTCYKLRPKSKYCFRSQKPELSSDVIAKLCRKTSYYLVYYKASWILLKVHYVQLFTNLLVVVIPPFRERILGNKRGIQYYCVIFIMWMIWRLQETFEIEEKWRRYLPYSCNITHSARYVIEAIILYVSSDFSMMRYKALARPLYYHIIRHKGHSKLRGGAVGVIIGTVCSVCNIIALHIMIDPNVGESCHLTGNGGKRKFLWVLIGVKAISLLLMYAIPCAIMISANLAIIYQLRRYRRNNMALQRSQSGRNFKKKTQNVVAFILFSSLFMMCCMPQPVYDLYLTVSTLIYRSVDNNMGMFIKAILGNLTIFAFIINTLVGTRYSP